MTRLPAVPAGVLLVACALLTAAPLLAGCADDPGLDSAPPPSIEPGTAPVAGPDSIPNLVSVRGLYIGPVFDSAAVAVSHEAIPGFMGAMRMQIRVSDRAELRGLREGDKIRFTLTDPDGNGYQITDITKLPPDTPLDLADFGPDAVPPEASLEGDSLGGGS